MGWGRGNGGVDGVRGRALGVVRLSSLSLSLSLSLSVCVYVCEQGGMRQGRAGQAKMSRGVAGWDVPEETGTDGMR